MRILVAGATGTVGRLLLPLLHSQGHDVAGLARSDSSAEAITGMGARPLMADVLNRREVHAAFETFRPEVVVHQLTALKGVEDLRKFEAGFALTNRLRVEGGASLIEATQATGARRIVAQSFCGWPYARIGGPVKSEDDPLDPAPPAQFRQTLEAIQQLEHMVASANGLSGTVLRYGSFYGPGTAFARDGAFVRDLQRRRVPLVGKAGGIFSFIHIEDVVGATVAAIEGAPAGIFNVTDDDPARVAEWLPFLARVVGARPPFRIPAWMMRLLLPEHLFVMMTDVRGGSNARFKKAFDWQPRYQSWRHGFEVALG